jgi:hypothetical protein
MGLEKRKKKLNLDVRIIFVAGSHTEHSWGCSKAMNDNEIANQSKPYVDEDPCVDKLRTCKLNFHPPCRLTIFKS